MKKLAFYSTLLIASIALFAFSPAGSGIEVGDMAPQLHLKMKDVSGKSLNLREIKQDQGLLVVFSCNTCPFVLAWEDRYNELYEMCAKKDIGMVLINSNEAKRNGDDSFEAMQKKAEKEGYKSLYVVDENSEIADAFGAKTTPHVYLFNTDMKLAYKGAIDDTQGKDGATVNNYYLKDAIAQMASGQTVDPQTTKSIGCSIKRVKG